MPYHPAQHPSDAALRRVREADGRDPWQRPDHLEGPPRLEEVRASRRRYAVRWQQRAVARLSPTQLRITAPLVGPIPPADFGYRLAQRLQTGLNSDVTVAAHGPLTVAANVAEVGQEPHLTMVITGRALERGRPFDSAHVNAPLENALRLLSSEDGTFKLDRAAH